MSSFSFKSVLATFIVVLIIGFGNRSWSQEVDKDSLSGDDLHYLGYVMLSGDTSAWVNMQSDDVYHLSKAMFYRDPKVLSYIKNDDLYFLGSALIYADDAELEKVVENDIYYLGKAIFVKQTTVLENIKSDDLYYLGKGLIEKQKQLVKGIIGQNKAMNMFADGVGIAALKLRGMAAAGKEKVMGSVGGAVGGAGHGNNWPVSCS